MCLQEDLRRAVFGEGVAYRPPDWRTKDGRIRQANENLTHVLNDWVREKNSLGRRLSFQTFDLPEKAGGWSKKMKREYLRFHRRAWLEFEKIRSEIISETPEVMEHIEAEAGREEEDVLSGLGYEERFANIP